jgi:hypothetical protein
MKFIFFSGFVLTTMTLIVAVASLSEEEKISAKEILVRILNDPEFLALDGPKQLEYLISIYNSVELNDGTFLKVIDDWTKIKRLIF